MHRPLLAPLGALALVALVLAPPAAASGVFVGPLAFYFVADQCNFATQSPPNTVLVSLVNAQGIISGTQVSSPAVTMVLTSGGFTLCQPDGNGRFIASGDGSGVIVAA
ncbi:MAG: hypothetical protein LC624_05690 [Halobacteriales archaeon]|nr:hypothetical protein [Halobacteriales archaeon]